ncbi:5' nucleotidase, NT5C type [Negadavirga shengliensis]|uniref:5'(3')-deoxyribonucleotidase n=1 Tax=Negadavirga shengliensis TaxID=1389218 RepID=A0ABV9SZ97_9BACT
MEKIAVDMDGVLADVYHQFIQMHFEESGVLLQEKDLEGLTEYEAFPHILKHVHTPGFFRTAPLISDSQEILEKLNHKYEVFIVSAATEFPLSLAEKQAWLNEHFPFIDWKHMVFCGSKEIIKADIMIDDHFKNLDFFEGQTFLFTQPHNTHKVNGKHKRVHSWKDIEHFLI